MFFSKTPNLLCRILSELGRVSDTRAVRATKKNGIQFMLHDSNPSPPMYYLSIIRYKLTWIITKLQKNVMCYVLGKIREGNVAPQTRNSNLQHCETKNEINVYQS